MKLLVISSSPFIKKGNDYFAYSPYAKELAIWAKYADEIAFTCPIWKQDNGLLISEISFPLAQLYEVKGFNVKTIKNTFQAFLYSFLNCYLIFKSMLWADHIHLRCPGNIGLMGCVLQIFFPHKTKTAKYAGNWDLNAKQPLSYRLQKWLLRNTYLTKNMQVLVYGEWENSTKNIKPFFTASYFEKDKTPLQPRNLNGKITFAFVGTLAVGKQPMYAVQLIEALYTKGFDVRLSVYGQGPERQKLEDYIIENRLKEVVFLEGNQNQEAIKKMFAETHFVILPSLSEGWPKVIAEGMFWGCFPLASKVSCLPNMLDNGNRGSLLTLDLQRDIAIVESVLNQPEAYKTKALNAMEWSRQYTLDVFESEIKKLLQS